MFEFAKLPDNSNNFLANSFQFQLKFHSITLNEKSKWIGPLTSLINKKIISSLWKEGLIFYQTMNFDLEEINIIHILQNALFQQL